MPSATASPLPEAVPIGPPPPLWRRVLPWVLGGLAVAAMIARTDRAELLRCCARVDLPLYALFIIAFCIANLATDVFATSYAYRLTVAPVDYRTLLVVRAASYLPSVVNYHMGQAYTTYVLANVYGASLLRVAAGTLVVYVTSVGAIAVLAALALPLSMRELPAFALPVLGLTAAGIGYLALLAWKPRRLAAIRFMAPLFETGALGHIRILAARMPHVLLSAAALYGSFWFFGIRLSPVQGLTYLPIILFVSVLPITPGGIGTRDAVAVALLQGSIGVADAKEARTIIVGAGLLWATSCLATTALIGLAFTRSASRYLRKD